MDNKIKIEVAFASNKQSLIPLEVKQGSTAHQAILASGILERHSDIDLNIHKIGIWSKQCNLDTELSNSDRVEIYRPITKDPKDARILRANKK